jgi:hypothetical protein
MTFVLIAWCALILVWMIVGAGPVDERVHRRPRG